MGAFFDFLDVVFPPSCVACSSVMESARIFCKECELQLERIDATDCCPRCWEPNTRGKRCHRCLLKTPVFESAFAPFFHDGALAKAIHHFKYEDGPQLAAPLGKLLAKEAQAFLEAHDGWLCPLPLHDKRFRQRQYDQAALLTAELGRHTRLPILGKCLKRIKFTQRQVGLPENEREANLHEAFTASPVAAGKRVILVDDVLTTGSTAQAAARALLQAGAISVHVVALSRANLTTG